MGTDEDRTTAVGLARYAYEYLEAAILVDEKIGRQPRFDFASPIPAYFLALHSIELSLKAYLRHHGVTVRELRSKKYGHDIKACYIKAKSHAPKRCPAGHPARRVARRDLPGPACPHRLLDN